MYLRVYFKVEVYFRVTWSRMVEYYNLKKKLVDYANTINVEFIVDPKVSSLGWLIYSYLQIFEGANHLTFEVGPGRLLRGFFSSQTNKADIFSVENSAKKIGGGGEIISSRIFFFTLIRSGTAFKWVLKCILHFMVV